jgi:hypothetical protein
MLCNALRLVVKCSAMAYGDNIFRARKMVTSFLFLKVTGHIVYSCCGLVRCCACCDAHEKCIRTRSVVAPHHQEVSPRGA